MQNGNELEIESSATDWDKSSYKNPSLLKGLLRKGQKMLIAAPPRSMKTSLALQLCKSVADGNKWLEWEVQQGNVLYVGIGKERQPIQNKIFRLYASEKENMGYQQIDYLSIKGEQTTVSDIVNQAIDLIRKKDKQYRLIVMDTIEYVQPLEGYSIHPIIAALDRLTIQCNCALVVTRTVRRELSEKSYKENLKVIHNDVLLPLFDSYIEFVELELTEKDLNYLQVGQVKEYFIEISKEHRPVYYKTNIPGNFFQKERTIEELRSHLEMAVPEDKVESVLTFYDSLYNPMKHDSYWQMVASSVEFPDLPSEKYIFRYPRLETDKENLLDMYEVGTFAFWKKSKVWDGEMKNINNEAKEQDLLKAIKDFEDSNNRYPLKKELAKKLGVSVRTVERRIEKSDFVSLANGKIILL